MSNLFDRAGMSSATTGTGTVTLGSALGTVAPNACSFLSFSAAGVADQNIVSYLILDSNGAWETGWGVYAASGTTLTRNVTKSSNSNAAINLSGNEQVFITARAEDLATIGAMRSVNLAINGGMEVSQESGTNVVSITPADTLKYVVDMWVAAFHGTNVYTGQQIGASGMPIGTQLLKALEIKATTGGAMAAGDYIQTATPIEGQVFRRAGWGTSNAQPITIGFWMAATINGSVGVTVKNGAGTRAYATTVSYTAATGWQWLTVTIPPDTTGTWATDSSAGAYVILFLGAGASVQGTPNVWTASGSFAATGTTNFFASTNNVVDLTGVVILPGSHQLSYEHSALLQRSYPEELRLCERYYELAGPGIIRANNSVGSQFYWMPWHTKKRAAPTIGTVTAPTYTNGNSFLVFNGSVDGLETTFQSTASTGFANGWVVSGDARM